MSHRIIIIESITPALQSEEVRDTLTPSQCTRVDQILNGTQPCSDDDFRYLTRRLNQAYCQGD